VECRTTNISIPTTMEEWLAMLVVRTTTIFLHTIIMVSRPREEMSASNCLERRTDAFDRLLFSEPLSFLSEALRLMCTQIGHQYSTYDQYTGYPHMSDATGLAADWGYYHDHGNEQDMVDPALRGSMGNQSSPLHGEFQNHSYNSWMSAPAPQQWSN